MHGLVFNLRASIEGRGGVSSIHRLGNSTMGHAAGLLKVKQTTPSHLLEQRYHGHSGAIPTPACPTCLTCHTCMIFVLDPYSMKLRSFAVTVRCLRNGGEGGYAAISMHPRSVIRKPAQSAQQMRVPGRHERRLEAKSSEPHIAWSPLLSIIRSSINSTVRLPYFHLFHDASASGE